MQLPVAHVAGAFEPLQVVPLMAMAALYAVRVRSLALGGRPVPGWRQISFASGMLLILVALVSPLAALDYELVWVHMAIPKARKQACSTTCTASLEIAAW